jgi:hypothetical protein
MTGGPPGGTRTYLRIKGTSLWRSTRRVLRPLAKVIWSRHHGRSRFLLTLLSTDLVDAITKDWGGKPFVDLQKGWKYALDKYPEIDSNKAVAAGASWGGYAIK